MSFGQDAEGNWGYKIGGADPVIPFRRVAYTSHMVTLGDSESAKFTFGTVSGFKLLSYTLKTDFSDRQVYLYVNRFPTLGNPINLQFFTRFKYDFFHIFTSFLFLGFI